ncbi:Ger(x)C family spore germination protein [Clostridium aestuarii]|uniref:Ger(X)C family spore germination protein n=1 Tax=Clostridium aestuarii TaxID=338193 RepID=A0ABT4CVV9_9CLOT|nr:Ger(x)C family spore germination C-terminal domain-containing protein [Clostridium aestuarii]MCY6483119.1 Ger(x)C family spore germination protein [Clostridium aestuarii]
MNYKKFLYTIYFCLGTYIFYLTGNTLVPAEDLIIPIAIGHDVIHKDSGDVEYSIPVSVYNFSEIKPTPIMIKKGIGETIGKTRENRQLSSNLDFILGLEKTLIFSEEYASSFEFINSIDILFNNPTLNDTALNVVCHGQSIDVLKLNIEGYTNSSDYIAELLTHCVEANFFSDNYKLLDIYVRVGAEGRTLVLPYLQIKDKKPTITGLAIFNKDKMAKVININEARILNLLKENKVKGILSLSKSPKEYIDFSTTTKREVSCEKVKNKYVFYIDISLEGSIIDNNLYKNIANDYSITKKFEEDMNSKVEKMCYRFIDKMQKEYKIDCLSLGSVAAAKYGRHTGTDWNKAVSEADIIVNVKTKIDKFGRGDY